MLDLLGKKAAKGPSGIWNSIVSEAKLQENSDDLPEIVEIPICKILLNPDQPRKNFGEEELSQLTESIQNYGILQPILVKPDYNGKYFIIAGERRYRAACQAGLSSMPCIVRPMEEEQAALISIVENVQRENLGFLEEAKAYKKLMDDYGLTQSEIARKVGKQQSTISNKIRILSLPEDIQDVLTTHRLTERHARALLRLSSETDRRKIAGKIVKNNLNVKQTEKLVADLLESQEEQTRKKKKINYFSYKIYVCCCFADSAFLIKNCNCFSQV